MKIVACVKLVPSTETQAKVGGDGKSLETAGVQYELSFYDEIAVEKAVQIKEAHGGEVSVLTLGPAAMQKQLRESLAKGGDDAVLLVDEDWSSRDCRSTAKAIAEKIQGMGAELVFCGRVATDRDNAAVGPMVATQLGWACVTDVIEFDVVDGKGVAKRETEGGVENYEFSLPAVITCQKGLAEPRYAGLKGIMAAKKKPLEEAPAAAVENHAQVVGLELPPPRAEGRILGEGPAAVDALMTALRDEAKVL